MYFKIKELKKILSSITKHNIGHIDIKSSNFNLIINTIKNRTTSSKEKYSINNTKTYNKIQNSRINNKIKTIKKHSTNEADTYFIIVSPMIGTFYRSPAPNEDPFIKANDKVKINQTVCIIEAMKLMNEIESEVNGRVVDILVKDGDIVDCGQALIRVKHE